MKFQIRFIDKVKIITFYLVNFYLHMIMMFSLMPWGPKDAIDEKVAKNKNFLELGS